MKIPRTLAVFICAAGAALALAITKALLVSGLDKLPPAKLLVFAASTFGLIVALLDWALFRDRRRTVPLANNSSKTPASGKTPVANERSTPPQTKIPQTDPVVQRVRLRPIVFREKFPPSVSAGLSFYGGVPIAPATLSWPRVRNKPGNAPLSFIMQWDCAELAGQDQTGLLPREGVFYLFGDLTWGDPFDFQFMHAPGPVDGMRAIPTPPDLPPLSGKEGAYLVPYCSPYVAKEIQAVPRLLPKWPFTPIAFSCPAPTDPGEPRENGEALFWNENQTVAEALLVVQHPEGVPPPRRRGDQPLPFVRPFPAFPHDHAAVRIVSAKVLHHLRHPASWLLRELTAQERETQFQAWRDQAAQVYASAAAHPPASMLEQSVADEIWRWMEGLKPVLEPGWRSLVEACANASLGLGSEAAGTLPAKLVAACAERHQLASAYLHEEHPNRREPDAIAKWEARKAAGTLQEVRSLHAPCPNRMFGPPSYVQGYVEEYLEEWVLLLELSSHVPLDINLGEGVLQFMIRPADLRERRFDKIELVASAY